MQNEFLICASTVTVVIVEQQNAHLAYKNSSQIIPNDSSLVKDGKTFYISGYGLN